jgi:hypothetical protein
LPILAKVDFGYPPQLQPYGEAKLVMHQHSYHNNTASPQTLRPILPHHLCSQASKKAKPVGSWQVETPLLLDAPRSACSASNHTADAKACMQSQPQLPRGYADNPLLVHVEYSYLNCPRGTRPGFLQSSFTLRHENALHLSYARPKGIPRRKRRRKR